MLKIDMEKLLTASNIPFKTAGDVHCSEGWLQLQCPYCNDGKYHLGWNILGQHFNCYACGSHSTWNVLSLLLHRPVAYIRNYVDKFPLDKTAVPMRKRELSGECKLPAGSTNLSKVHKRYIAERGFIPEKMVELYNVTGTPAYAPIGQRIIIPIYWDGILVSWTARNITDDEPRYLKCPKDREALPSRSVLYGWTNTLKKAVVVEGIFDAWRLGPGAVSTMGLGFSPEQVELLSNLNKVYILFDNDKPAKRRSMDMAKRLCTITDVEILELSSYADPAELPQHKANKLMKELGFHEDTSR